MFLKQLQAPERERIEGDNLSVLTLHNRIAAASSGTSQQYEPTKCREKETRKRARGWPLNFVASFCSLFSYFGLPKKSASLPNLIQHMNENLNSFLRC
jgi:hypothetical protein